MIETHQIVLEVIQSYYSRISFQLSILGKLEVTFCKRIVQGIKIKGTSG